jgi:hypothetical protein
MATAAVDPGDATAEAIPDWHYWVAMGLWLLIYAGQPKTHKALAANELSGR